MSYQVLARKWRPQTFDTLIGQMPIVKALKHSIDANKLHHAYLFTGTRGVGKTTIARVLAKALNCQQGPTVSPCLTCNSCQAIAEGHYPDLIEVDAASRTRVEDTREILDNVQYAPTQGRYKIYLIDEVHMLSGHSFNALLKTLEEPPSHVIFLLATTDPQKIPMTVMSRCLHFCLKPIPTMDIASYLAHVCQGEQVQYQENALQSLAESAKGSLRDALSLLDQAIAYTADEVTHQDVLTMLGSVDDTSIFNILTALLHEDGEMLMTLSRTLRENGVDYKSVLARLMQAFHDISVSQCVEHHHSNFAEAQIKGFSQSFSKEDIQLCYEICFQGYERLGYMPSQSSGFEMVLLRLLAFNLSKVSDKPSKAPPEQISAEPCQVPQNISADDNQLTLSSQAKASSATVDNIQETTAASVEKKPEQVLHLEVPDIDEIGDRLEVVEQPVKTVQIDNDLSPEDWTNVVESLPLVGVAKSVLQHCRLLRKASEEMVLGVDMSYQAMLTTAARSAIEKALRSHWQCQFRVVFEISSEPQTQTPAALKQQKHNEQLQQAKDRLQEDPCFNEIIKRFDGKIDENAIQLNKK